MEALRRGKLPTFIVANFHFQGLSLSGLRNGNGTDLPHRFRTVAVITAVACNPRFHMLVVTLSDHGAICCRLDNMSGANDAIMHGAIYYFVT